MIEPAQGEDGNDSSDDESLASTLTSPPPKRPPVKEPGDRLQGGLGKHKMFQVPPTEK